MEVSNPRPANARGITSDDTSERENGESNTKPQAAINSVSEHSSSIGNENAKSAAAPVKLKSTKAVDPKRTEEIKFVASFMKALTQGQRKGKANKDVTRKRKERKRQINRASARRKRLRDKQELEELANLCRDLESSITKLRSENSVLSGCLRDEMEIQSRSIVQLEQLRANMHAPSPAAAVSMPLSVPSAAAPVHDAESLLESLVNYLTPTNETGQLLQEYMQVERALQDMLAQQRQQEQQQQLQQQLQLQELFTCLLGGIAASQQPAPTLVAPPPSDPGNQDVATQLQNILLVLAAGAVALGDQQQPTQGPI